MLKIEDKRFAHEYVLEFQDGEVIFEEGADGREMYIVQEGEVSVSKKSAHRDIPLATLKKGDFVGEMALLESLPRSATTRAVGKTRLVVLQPGGFLLKIRRDPTLAFEMLQRLSRRIRVTNERLLSAIDREPSVEAIREIVQGAEDPMITDIRSDKLAVISDLHLGNPFCKTKRRIIAFLHWAADQGYDLCINGDGFEIAQTSFHKLAQDVPEVLHALKAIAKKGGRTYYIVGNHDIAFENFLDDWGNFKMAPFLNVTSGNARIRVEHGHLYDPFFVRYPRVYELSTWFAGLFLQISPSLYRTWIGFEKFRSYRRARRGEVITGEAPQFAAAAHTLAQRGFDHVVFGHTHHVGEIDLGNGKTYLNPGSWMMGCTYVAIEAGRVELRRWSN